MENEKHTAESSASVLLYIRRHPGCSSLDIEADLGVRVGLGGVVVPLDQAEYRGGGWWPKDSVAPTDLWASPRVVRRLQAIVAELYRVVDRVDQDSAPFDAIDQTKRLISDLGVPANRPGREAQLTGAEQTTLASLRGRVQPGPLGGMVTSISKSELQRYLDLIEKLLPVGSQEARS